jgi:photosystem II stability/assembly factor-like uncharacterized protein
MVMSKCLHVATRKGLFTVERQGASPPSWTITRSAFLGDNVSMVLSDGRDGRLYAALELGHFGVKLHRSPGPGEPWEECAAPAYPKQPDGEVDKDGMGRPIPWTTVKIWALEAGGRNEPGVLWCGTIPGGLFRSDDGGMSWSLVRSLWDHPKRKDWFGGGADLPGIHSICVDPRDPKCVRIGISCGGVWTTRDGGGNWECGGEGMRAAYMPPERQYDPNIQDVHRLVQCASMPESLWVQHHNGIFRSGDGGRRWQEIESARPSSFGFAVAVHPNSPDTAWFVPALSDEQRIPVGGELVVTRTRDGGNSFDVLRRNLPQQHAYDIVFRHALDVDESGEWVAFGTTNGGLWISEDQGDSWRAVAAHLPPIYCVRFARA